MSTLIGNTSLAVAALLSWLLITSGFNYKAPVGGSGGAEAYPIWILLLGAGLLAAFTIAVIAIAANGGFDWISTHKLVRYTVVGIVFLAAFWALVVSALTMGNLGSEAEWLQVYARMTLVTVPVVFVGAGLVLLNSTWRNAVPALCYQLPLLLTVALGGIAVGGEIVERMTSPSSARAKRQAYENAEPIKAANLKVLDQYDVEEDKMRILELTGIVYPQEVREKASAKFKTHPNWQQELIQLLDSDEALSAFNFLACNEIPDKKAFAGPVNTGIVSVAHWIIHHIQGSSPSSFKKDSYSDETDVVLQTLDKMEGMGMDYKPAMQELRAAFDEPRMGKKPIFDDIAKVENWIKSH